MPLSVDLRGLHREQSTRVSLIEMKIDHNAQPDLKKLRVLITPLNWKIYSAHSR